MTQKRDRENTATFMRETSQLVLTSGLRGGLCRVCWTWECPWLTVPWLSSLSYLKGGFTCYFISSIHTLWFTVICHSLQLLWNDSLPCKFLSHKLKHFYPVYPYVLVCIFPNLTQLYFPCISSHRLSITNPPYARLAGKVFDKLYTNCISQEVLHFKWQKSNSNSIESKNDLYLLP